MRVLMVLSSSFDPPGTAAARIDQLRAFAGPFYLFADAGLDVVLASPLGGLPPIAWPPPADVGDPVVARYRADRDARDLLSDTLPLAGVVADDFDLAFYPGDGPGRRGALAELAEDEASQDLLLALWPRAPLAFVGSATAALLNLRDEAGAPLIRGRRLTGSSWREQTALAAAGSVPPSLHDALVRRGAQVSHAADGAAHVVRDGRLVTGQNASSAEPAARAALALAQAR